MNHEKVFQSFSKRVGMASTDGDRRNVHSREGIVFGDNFTQILLEAQPPQHLPDHQTPAAALFRFHSDPILSFNFWSNCFYLSMFGRTFSQLVP